MINIMFRSSQKASLLSDLPLQSCSDFEVTLFQTWQEPSIPIFIPGLHEICRERVNMGGLSGGVSPWPYMAGHCLHAHHSQLLLLLCPDSWAIHQTTHITSCATEHTTALVVVPVCSLVNFYYNQILKWAWVFCDVYLYPGTLPEYVLSGLQ